MTKEYCLILTVNVILHHVACFPSWWSLKSYLRFKDFFSLMESFVFFTEIFSEDVLSFSPQNLIEHILQIKLSFHMFSSPTQCGFLWNSLLHFSQWISLTSLLVTNPHVGQCSVRYTSNIIKFVAIWILILSRSIFVMFVMDCPLKCLSANLYVLLSRDKTSFALMVSANSIFDMQCFMKLGGLFFKNSGTSVT